MNEGEEAKKSFQEKVSVLGALDRRWVVYGAVGVVLGMIGKYAFIDQWIWKGISWTSVSFFLIYTFTLFLLFSLLTNQCNRYSDRSLRPNGLTRFRSYLTFLPITQIIPHGDGKESLRTNESPKIPSERGNENDLSIRISIQKELVIDAILEEYIEPWYTKISSNKVFLKQSKEILRSVFQQFGEKILQVDRTELAKEAIQTVHLHWKEYCDAADKCAATSESILKCFKFVHPYLQDSTEVANRYEHMISQLLEVLVIPDLQSSLLCQFLSGILVKSCFLYYADFICQPSWINNNLITVLSSSSALAELAGSSSQNSSAPATPLPDSFDTGPKTLPSELSSPLPTPSQSESSASAGVTPPTQILTASKIIEDDSDTRFFFGKDTQEALIKQENYQKNVCSADSFEKEKVGERSPRIRIGSGSSNSPSVSIALSGILPTTALPLLPAGSYRLDHGPTFGFEAPSLDHDNSSVDTKIPPSETISNHLVTADDVLEPEKTSTVNISYSLSESIKINEFSPEPCSPDICYPSTPEREGGNLSRNSSPSHYYSFDEAGKRKPNQLTDSGTLSVDGDKGSSPQRGDRSCNHELKIANNDLEFDKKPNRSPVYEEPEDFATSIAKLRSLLEQRDSKKNLNCLGTDDTSQSDISSCASPDPNDSCQETLIEDNLKSLEEIHMPDFTYNPIHDGTNANPINQKQIMDKQVHELKCYFFNIAIPKVESCNDSGGQYDFYCIQYEGVYFDEKFDDQPPKVILRTTTVKRRFKEFLLLQSKLEEHTIWKPHLKGVKAPNRWLNLSFSKSDAAATRKTMLERYLQQICYHPILGTSREVLQFMAYGDDSFSLDPLDVHDPKHLLSDRLDKLARKFTGVMNTLRDVLPSFESTPPSPHSEVGTPPDNKPEYSIPSFQFHEKLSPEETNSSSPPDPKWIENLAPKFTKCNNSDESYEDSDEKLASSHGGSNNSDIAPDTDQMEDGSVNSSYPLAAALTQLLCDVLWLPNCRPHNASVSTFMSISGKSLENYVHETIDVFLSQEAVLGYLEWLAKCLKADPDSCDEMLNESITESDLKNCLRRRIPAWVRWMWGRNRLDMTIERITGFFQNPTVNHDLVLSLSELLFSKMVKGEEDIYLQNNKSSFK